METVMEFVAQMVVAMFTAIAVIGGGICSYLAAKHSRKANDAVNNVHPNRPRLADNVLKIGEHIGEIKAAQQHQSEMLDKVSNWQDSYQGGPLDDGDKVEEFVLKVHGFHEKVEFHMKENNKQHEEIRQALDNIVEKVNGRCPECPGDKSEDV